MTKLYRTDDSIFLSYILRHKPEELDLQLDINGWVSMDVLIAAHNKNNPKRTTPWTRELLQQIVDDDSKGRYSIKVGQIRANQGHSTSQVALEFTPTTPPDVLYHGTSKETYELIKQSGAIVSRSRHYVHLSADVETAEQVGMRRKKSPTSVSVQETYEERKARTLLILEIDAKRMHEDGFVFYISDNGVWLANSIPHEYVSPSNSK